MVHALSQLLCWASGKGAGGTSGEERLGRPWCPIPHFYNETWLYLAGDIRVLDKLPAVQAAALAKARQSTTPAACPSIPGRKGQAKTLATLTLSSQEEREDRRTKSNNGSPLPPLYNTPAFLPFKEMVQREIPLVPSASSTCSQVTPWLGSADESLLDRHLHDVVASAIRASKSRLVYDGLRSSPPLEMAGPHSWRRHTGVRLGPAHRNKGGHGHDNGGATEPSEYRLTAPNTSPRVEVALLAVRGTPRLIHHRHSHGSSSAKSISRAEANMDPPIAPPRANNNKNNNPSSRPNPNPSLILSFPKKRIHYTTPQGQHTLSLLRSYLLLSSPSLSSSTNASTSTSANSDSDALPPPPAHLLLLTDLLLRWPAVRRALPQHNPPLAAQANTLDWRGVERGLPERSFARRLVEEWVRSGSPLFSSSFADYY